MSQDYFEQSIGNEKQEDATKMSLSESIWTSATTKTRDAYNIFCKQGDNANDKQIELENPFTKLDSKNDKEQEIQFFFSKTMAGLRDGSVDQDKFQSYVSDIYRLDKTSGMNRLIEHINKSAQKNGDNIWAYAKPDASVVVVIENRSMRAYPSRR